MKSVLLISVQGIGNTVLMTPVIEAIAAKGYHVDVVVSDNGSHEVLKLRNDVRRRYVWRERENVVKNLLRLRSEMRRARYDAAYALYPNGKRENVLLGLARAVQKSRYTDRRSRYRLLDFLPATHKIPLNEAHDVNNNLRLIQSTESMPHQAAPALSLSGESQDFTEDFLSSKGFSGKFVVAVHPGGGGPAKRWSETKYRELCSRLTQDDSIRLMVFGSASEERLVRDVSQSLGDRALVVCGLPIEKVAALISQSQLLVANDSALAHMASGFGVPVIVIWGYTDFRRAAPVNNKGLLIRMDYPCNPCYDFAKGYIDDCVYHLKCIRDISTEQVHQIVQRYISLIKTGEELKTDSFAQIDAVTNVDRLESGCVKIDLRSNATQQFATSLL